MKTKRTYRIVNIVFPADHRVKIKENEKKDKTFPENFKKDMKHEGNGDTNCN